MMVQRQGVNIGTQLILPLSLQLPGKGTIKKYQDRGKQAQQKRPGLPGVCDPSKGPTLGSLIGIPLPVSETIRHSVRL